MTRLLRPAPRSWRGDLSRTEGASCECQPGGLGAPRDPQATGSGGELGPGAAGEPVTRSDNPARTPRAPSRAGSAARARGLISRHVDIVSLDGFVLGSCRKWVNAEKDVPPAQTSLAV